MSLFVAAGLAFAGLAAWIGWDGLHDRPGQADLILVLGSKVMPDGRPSRSLRVRLDRAAEEYRASGALVLVSGGPGEGVPNPDEADVMAAYLAAHGIDPDRIVKDHDGWNTYASARNTAALLRERHLHGVVVVSQFFHLPRARYALGRFGVAPVYTARAHLVDWHDLYFLAREAAGAVAYRLKSYPKEA